MRILLIGVGVVAALLLVIVLIGLSLPRAHVAAMTANVAATPDVVFRTITDHAQFPTWRTDVQRVERLPATPTGPSWREHSSDGAITYATEAAEPPRRLVTRIVDRNLPFGGSWEYRIEPEGSGSRVTITERGEVYNPVFRVVSRFIMGHTATIDRVLRALGRKFGAEPAPVAIQPT